MEWPLLEEGDRRFRVDHDKYLKNLEELSAEVHKYGVPDLHAALPPGPLGRHLRPYRRAGGGVRRHAVPRPFDVHDEEPPRALTIEEIEELVDRFASGDRPPAEGRLGRHRDQRRPPTTSSTASCRASGTSGTTIRPAEHGEPHAASSCEVIKEIKKRCGQDFPVQILMNAVEIGAGDEGLTIEEGKEIARIYQSIGVDSLHVRYHWSGMHQGSYTPRTCSIPSRTSRSANSPRRWTGATKGHCAKVPLAAGIKKVVTIPVMTVGASRRRLGRERPQRGQGRLIGINRRFFADHNYANKVRRAGSRHPALHPVRQLQQELQRSAVLPHQRLLSARSRTTWRRSARRRRWSW